MPDDPQPGDTITILFEGGQYDGLEATAVLGADGQPPDRFHVESFVIDGVVKYAIVET